MQINPGRARARACSIKVDAIRRVKRTVTMGRQAARRARGMNATPPKINQHSRRNIGRKRRDLKTQASRIRCNPIGAAKRRTRCSTKSRGEGGTLNETDPKRTAK